MVSKSKVPDILEQPGIAGFIESFTKDIANGTAAIFAGAGLSVASGYVNWAELMRGIAQDLGLDVDRESNLVAIAQYHLNERGNRTKINQTLIEEFSAGHTLNENHKVLARLPIDTYWTTNYDGMIEKALENANKIVDVKWNVNHLKKYQPNRNVIVYKMHGDVRDPDDAVLTKDDYEGYFRDRELFVTKLAGDLISKTMLFIGFSFSDPNIDYILSRVRVVLHRKTRQHYCILKKESRRGRESLDKFRYRQKQQEYFIKDLSRIGVHTILIDDFKDITKILTAVERRYRERTVFISGSAFEFGTWKPDEASNLLQRISAGLIDRGLNVATGFGLGVGPSVISGALQVIMDKPRKYFHSQLQAHPFPVEVTELKRTRLFREHRERVIATAGIAIFAFGNKRNAKGKIVRADGVYEEFRIAKELGLSIIPIGATGWVAEEISDELSSVFQTANRAISKSFKIASDVSKSPEEIADAVLSLVDARRKATR